MKKSKNQKSKKKDILIILFSGVMFFSVNFYVIDINKLELNFNLTVQNISI